MAESSLSDMFERTWRERSTVWRAYALRLTRNPADADDVVLEAAARTLATQPDLDSELRLHAYVTTAIRHIALSVVRRRGREVAFVDDNSIVGRSFASSALELAVRGEARELRKSLSGAAKNRLRSLPRGQREAIELIVLRTPPLKLREVAEIQGVTTSTVSYRLNRGLEVLAATVARGVDDERSG